MSLSTSERFHWSKDLSNIWSQQNFESSDIILSSYLNIMGAHYGSYLTIYFVTELIITSIFGSIPFYISLGLPAQRSFYGTNRVNKILLYFYMVALLT